MKKSDKHNQIKGDSLETFQGDMGLWRFLKHSQLKINKKIKRNY